MTTSIHSSSSLFPGLRIKEQEALTCAQEILDQENPSEPDIETCRSKLRTIYLQKRAEHHSDFFTWLSKSLEEFVSGNYLEKAYHELDCALVGKQIPLQKHDYTKPIFDPKAFPKFFKWGAGTCEYQISGAETCKDSQWAAWEESHVEHPSKTATDHYNQYIEDIELLKNLGLTSYRFSVDWSLIEPKPCEYNEEALVHYQDLCSRLKEANIEPCITLHHFAHPLWFEELGGFEKEENIEHIVRFTRKIVKALPDVETWFTINEPNVYAAMGYHSGFIGHFPPEGNYQYQKMAEVYANCLRAHDQMYEAIKESATIPTQVGIVHQMLQMEADRSWDTGPVVARYMNWLFMSDAFINFARSGEFRMYVPGLVDVCYISDKLRHDFIGINYYSKPLVRVGCGTPDHMWAHFDEGEVLTDMNFRTHPEGLYQWLRKLSTLGLPLLITENGIADSKDDRRGFFIQQQLYAIQKAIEEGANVQGYFHWSAFDNSEWEHGIGVKNFGLYAINWETKERRLRPGALPYIDAISQWRKA